MVVQGVAALVRRQGAGRIAVDGMDGVGKTNLRHRPRRGARPRLVGRARGRPPEPAGSAARRGRYSPEGFWLDSYDLDSIHAAVTDQVVVDGLFLHRDELFGLWDFSVCLDAPFEVTVHRMAARDGTDPDPRAASNRCYVEGQRLYFAACRPWDRASVVVDATLRVAGNQMGRTGPSD